MIYVISGKTCSGKSSVFKKIISKKYSPKPIITYTTRKPRDGEVEGVDYHFVEQSIFEDSDDFVCVNSFYVSGEGVCYYGIKKSDVEDSEDKIVILTPSGYREMKERYGDDVYGFYLMVPDYIQYDRYISRDPHNTFVGDEAVRRIAADKVDFENFEFDIEDVIINKSMSIEDIARKVLNSIFISSIENEIGKAVCSNGRKEEQEEAKT